MQALINEQTDPTARHAHVPLHAMRKRLPMSPADEDDDAERARRLDSWQRREPPKCVAFPGDPRGRERQHPRATLTPLGERRLGLQRWPHAGEEQGTPCR